MRNKIFSWHRLNKLLSDKKGVTAIEYAMIACLVGISIIASLKVLGNTIQEQYECVASAITGSGSCGGGASFPSESVSHDVSKGWFTSDIEVKAGETYEIKFPENFQFTLWNNSPTWYNPDQNFYTFSAGIAAVVSSNKMNGKFVSDLSNHEAYTFKDGKITVTAQQDGYLNVGIVDTNAADNWTTTNGGATQSRDMSMIITRVK
jgi:pilus assembly protein Flp/PilA